MLIRLRRVGAVIEDVRMPARYSDKGSHLSVTRTLIQFPGLLLRKGLRRIVFHPKSRHVTIRVRTAKSGNHL